MVVASSEGRQERKVSKTAELSLETPKTER